MAAPTTSFTIRCRGLGIDVTFVDPRDPDNFAAAVQPNTKLIYGETLGNPDITVFPRGSYVYRPGCIPLVIDNTFATPYLFRPFEWGCTISCCTA